jgi:hypothetical protein
MRFRAYPEPMGTELIMTDEEEHDRKDQRLNRSLGRCV